MFDSKRIGATPSYHLHGREMRCLTQSARSLECKETEGRNCVHGREHFHEAQRLMPLPAQKNAKSGPVAQSIDVSTVPEYPVPRSLSVCQTLGNLEIQKNQMLVDNHPAVEFGAVIEMIYVA